jgi:hypothetical protein
MPAASAQNVRGVRVAVLGKRVEHEELVNVGHIPSVARVTLYDELALIAVDQHDPTGLEAGETLADGDRDNGHCSDIAPATITRSNHRRDNRPWGSQHPHRMHAANSLELAVRAAPIVASRAWLA